MNTKALGIIVLVVAAGLGVAFVAPVVNHSLISADIMSGYSGLEARMLGVDIPIDYKTVTYSAISNKIILDVNLASAASWIEANDPTGLTVSISQPQQYQVGTPVQTATVNSRFENETGNYTVSKYFKSTIITMQMSIEFQTSGWGLEFIRSLTYWIQLQQNPNTVFQKANSSFAAILDVVTHDIPTTNGGTWTISPDASGFDLPLTSLSTVPVPEWVSQMNYTDTISNLAIVKFPVSVVKAAPSSTFGGWRVDGDLLLKLDIDVLLLGEWIQVRPWHATELPPPPPNPFAAVGAALMVLFGLVVTIALLVKVPDPKFKVVGLVIVWLVIAWWLGWINALIGAMGFG